MFDSKLAKKFLAKIDSMTFREIDERATKASSCGIHNLIETIHDAEWLSTEDINILRSRLGISENYREELRRDFEQLPYIASRLYSSTFVDFANSYKPTTFDDSDIVADMHFLNGAWYAYQAKDLMKQEGS